MTALATHIHTSTLTVTVYGPLGDAISGATVSVPGGASATTDGSGVAVLDLVPGVYVVTAHAGLYTDASESVEVGGDTSVVLTLGAVVPFVGAPLDRDTLLGLAIVTLPADEDAAIRLWEETMPRAYRGLLTGDGWSFDPSTQSYTSTTGTELSAADLKRISLTFAIAIETAELEPLASLVADGSMPIADFQIAAANIIRETYIAQALLASGGRGHLTPEDVASIQGSADAKTGLEFGMDRLWNFGNVMSTGDAGGAMQVVHRTGLYSSPGNSVFEGVRGNSHGRAVDAETGRKLFMYERNVLGDAEHCASTEFTEGCVDVTAKGWQPLDSLPKIGDRTCGPFCKCFLEFVLVPEGNENQL